MEGGISVEAVGKPVAKHGSSLNHRPAYFPDTTRWREARSGVESD